MKTKAWNVKQKKWGGGGLNTEKTKDNGLKWQSEESRRTVKMTCYPRSSVARVETCSMEFSSLMS